MYGSIGDVEYNQATLGLASRLALEDVRLCLRECTTLDALRDWLLTRRSETKVSWLSTVPHALAPSVLEVRDIYLGQLLDTLSPPQEQR